MFLCRSPSASKMILALEIAINKQVIDKKSRKNVKLKLTIYNLEMEWNTC